MVIQKFLRRFCFLLFVLAGLRAYSQDSIACYFDKQWDITNIKDSAAYFRVGEKNASGDWVGHVKDYYISGELQMHVRYNNGKRIGLGEYFHENGQLELTGQYQDDERTGVWKCYHKNGRSQYEGLFEEGKRSGAWKEYHDNGQLAHEGV